MPYKEPLEAELDKSIQALENDYRLKTQNNINPRRIALIHFVQGIQENSHQNSAKIAAMILGFCLIGGNLKYLIISPEKWTFLGYKIKGSELYDLLISGLKLKDPEKNQLDNCTAIEYLADLFDFLKKSPQITDKLIATINSDKLLSKPIWKNSDELLKSIENVVSKLLADQSQNISDAIYKRLTSDFIKKKLIEVVQSYRDLKKGNAVHDLLVDCIEFIILTSNFYGETNNKDLQLTTELTKAFSRSYNLLMGIVRYAMVELENETTVSNWISLRSKAWSTKNSKLYQALSTKFSVNYSTDFNYSESHDFLDELSVHLRKFNYFKQMSLYAQNKELFNRIEKNLNYINFQLTEQKKILSAQGEIPSGISARVGANVKYLTEFGFNTVVGKAASTIFVPEIGKQAVRAVGGAIGYVLFGPTGAFIGICIADHVATAYLQTTVSGFTISAVQPIGSKLGSVTGDVVSIAIYPAEQGIRYVFSSNPELAKKQRELVMHNEKFLSALCKFPDKVFSQEKKEIIEMTQENDRKSYSATF